MMNGFRGLEEALQQPEPAAALSPQLSTPPFDQDVETARRIVDLIFGPPGSRPFAVRYWNGWDDGAGDSVRFTMVVRTPGALRRVLLPPSELAMIEAFLDDSLDVEGEMMAAGQLADSLQNGLRSPAAIVEVARLVAQLPRDPVPRTTGAKRRLSHMLLPHTKKADERSVRFHYDVGNDFYRLWLDRRMQYSCAYFPTGAESLDDAQTAKLEHICRKLRLQPGERLLDVGCGWGGLLHYAGTRYGVEGVGITLSEEQAKVARKRLAAAGLGERCRIEVRDYRDMHALGGFDKAVSIGMREHVGASRLEGYFSAVSSQLRPGGLFLDHGIARGGMAETRGVRAWAARRVWRRDEFIRRYVFPGGELVPVGRLATVGERAGLEVRDIENLREHYTRTLQCWVERLEAQHREIVSLVGERTYRVWRLYVAGAALGFASGSTTLIQTLYAKPHAGGRVDLPPTREDLYRS